MAHHPPSNVSVITKRSSHDDSFCPCRATPGRILSVIFPFLLFPLYDCAVLVLSLFFVALPRFQPLTCVRVCALRALLSRRSWGHSSPPYRTSLPVCLFLLSLLYVAITVTFSVSTPPLFRLFYQSSFLRPRRGYRVWCLHSCCSVFSLFSTWFLFLESEDSPPVWLSRCELLLSVGCRGRSACFSFSRHQRRQHSSSRGTVGQERAYKENGSKRKSLPLIIGLCHLSLLCGLRGVAIIHSDELHSGACGLRGLLAAECSSRAPLRVPALAPQS